MKKYCEEHPIWERYYTIGQVAAETIHDLCTPVSIVSNYLELMLRKEENATKNKEYLEESIAAIKDCEELLNNFRECLMFGESSISSVKDISINDVVRCAVRLFSVKKYVEIKFILNLDENLPQISGSGFELKKVFVNIISNSIKAMEKGGEVKIVTRIKNEDAGGKWVEFELTNTGPCISEENREKLFVPFCEGRTGSNGSGLGLHICKRILEKHNGTILIKNMNEKGVAFVGRLPV